MNGRIAVVLLALSPTLADADSVFLKGGGEIKGEVVERRPDTIVMEVGPGRITLPMSRVLRVVSSTTDLGVYNARASALAPRDVAGWLDLARWAEGRQLGTQAHEAYAHVLAVDGLNAAAHTALGDVLVGTRWMSVAAANSARGLVEFEGAWMTPEERQDRIAERAAAEGERQAAREADARAREAEARVREAEARARAAEADARQSDQPVTNGLPYPYGYGGGPFIPGPYNPFPPPRPAHHHRPPPEPAVVVVPVRPTPPPDDRPPPPAHRTAPAGALPPRDSGSNR
jgi:hypothetical protein